MNLEKKQEQRGRTRNKKKPNFEGSNPLSKTVVERGKEIKVKTKKRQNENQEKEDSHQKNLDQLAPNVDSDNNKTLKNSIGSLSSELNDQEISWVKSLAKKNRCSR
jgi:hypothetical protein